MSNQHTANQGGFFNDHYEGIAFINRPRRVTTRPGVEPFYALDLAVRYGPKDGKEIMTRKVDCIVRGSRAIKIIEDLLNSYDFDRNSDGTDGKPKAPSISTWFRAGDLEADVYQDGQGNPKPKMRARLLSLEFVKVSGIEGYFDDDPKFGNRRKKAVDGADEKNTATPEPVNTDFDKAAFIESIMDTRVVQLNKQEDPHFHEKKAALKEQGYSWNASERSWELQLG